MNKIKDPRAVAQTLFNAASTCEILGSGQLARDLEQLAERVRRTPIWERVEPGRYRTLVDGQQTDLTKRPDGQWLLEADWVGDTGVRWFRTRTEAQGWVERKATR